MKMLLRRCLPVLALTLFVGSLAHAQTPLRLVNVTPCRLVDTRSGNGPFQGTQTFDLRTSAQNGGAYGTCNPFDLSSAQTYSLNVTLVPVNGHPVGYLTIWPTGQQQPFVSLLNSDGRVKANAGIVPAGTDGKVNVFVTDTTDVLIDINAYFDSASDSSALAFFPLPPCRIIDTRGGQDGGTLHAMEERDYSIPSHCGVPANAQAYSFNVTALPTTGQLYYLTVWPQGESQPVVSTLNDLTGTIVANAAIVPAGPNNTTAFWAYNDTDLLLDINGYFAPANSASNPLSLYNVTPCRVLDTRNTIGLFNGTIPVAVVGSSCGIPGTEPESFVLNATIVPNGPVLYLSLWPQDQQQPQVSTLNAFDGAITSNMAIVPASMTNDAIDAFVPLDAQSQLILDISSYFAPIATLNVETTSLPNGTLNAGYSAPLVATGGLPPYTWTKTGGSLPPGLNLISSGTISGTPTSTGNFNFTVQAADSNSPPTMASANLQITVNATQITLAITGTSLPSATVNTPYNTLLVANGGITPYTWSIPAGALPAGLSLVAGSGQITGTPQAAGLSTFTVQVTDAQNHTAMAPLGIAVNTGSGSGSLNGSYALNFFGFDGSIPFVSAASVTVDGNGNVVTGEFDELTAGSQPQHSQITGGSYSIDANGLGSLTLTSPAGSETMLFSIGSARDIHLIAYNPAGPNGIWGSGVMRQQNPADFNLASLTGNWTFGFSGFDASLNSQAGAGSYHQDASGNLNGQEDINIDGQESTVPFAGTMSAADANGRVTLHLQFGHQVLTYAAYLVSANEIIVTEIDAGQALLTATSLRQSGTLNNGIFHGKAVGRESRIKNNGTLVSDASVLLASFDGAGNDTLTIDENFGGTLLLQQMGSGNYSVDPTTGRTFVGISGGGGDICYPVQRNEAFCFEPSSSHPALLFFQAQATGQNFNTAYLNGEYLGGSLPQYVSTTDSTIDTLFLDGLGNGSTTYSQSGPDGTTLNQTGNGTYSVDGTGHITISGSGGPTAYGYIVGPERFFLISTDSDPRVLIQVRSSAP